MTVQTDYATDGSTVAFQRQLTYNAKGQATSESVSQKQGTAIFTSTVTNGYGTGAAYALGAVLTVTSDVAKNGVDADAPDTLTTNAYQWWDGAVQSTIAHDPDTGSSSNPTWNTTYNYSASGQLETVGIADGRPRTITFTNDMLGQIIRRDEADNSGSGDPHEVWYRYSGKQMGYVGNNGTLDTSYHVSIENRQLKGPDEGQAGAFRFNATNSVAHADFDQSVDPINSYGQGSAGGSYTVRAGDTLGTIAATLWGDGSLWYKLAEANGMSAAGALIEGQTLVIPQGVMKSAHNAGTFKPYDPAEAIGDTSPTTPQPGKKSNKCGAFGQILLVAVAVAVTAILRVPVTSMITAAIKGAVGVGSALVGAAGTIAGGAVVGAAGSIASQGFGLATGIQDKFSWKGVGLAAIGGGVGGALGPGGAFGKLGAFGGVGSSFAQGALRGALGNAAIQGVGMATGLQGKFDWAGVAAAGLGGGVSNWTEARLGSAFGARLTANSAGGIANAAVRSLANGSNFGDNLIAALPDVIGSTVGNSIASGVTNRIEEGGVIAAKLEAAEIIAAKEAAATLVVSAKEAQLRTDLDLYLQKLIDGSALSLGEIVLAQNQARNPRARIGGNGGPPLIDPRTGQPLGIPILNGPLGPLWAPLDGILDITGPANRLQAGLLDRERERLRAELRSLDSNWRERASVRVPGPESLQSKLSDVTYLRTERAVLRYHNLGDVAPLQAETLRVYQEFVDQGYAQAMELHRTGRLRIPRGWSANQAIGSYLDAYARRSMRQWYGQHNIAETQGGAVAVNRRLYNESEGSYRVPDVSVGTVRFDATLSTKSVNTPQVRGFFGNSSTSMVVIVRPSIIGPSYIISEPR